MFLGVKFVAAPKSLVEVWRARTNTINCGGVFFSFGGTLLAEDGVIEMPSVGLWKAVDT